MEIKFDHVSYVYNANTPLSKVALQDVTIEFKEGFINGIIGKSGSGKSTLVELMNALMLPTRGSIKIDRRVLSQTRKIRNVNQLRYKIGLVFQNPEEQFFCPTVRKEIEFGMRYFHKKVSDIRKHVSDALKMVELDDSYLERDPFSLSSGEMRKVAIASILAFNPKVVILDEPTVGLDYKSKENLVRIIKMLKTRYQKTVIIVTHDTDLLLKMADYVVVLHEGKVVLQGDKYEVLADKTLPAYGMEAPKIIQFEQLVRDKKGVKMMYRDDINDLMKDVYRHVK